VPGFDKEDLPDRSAHRNFLGFIFVNLDPDASPDGRLVPEGPRGTGGFVPHWAG
jgi:hypothetical protein